MKLWHQKRGIIGAHVVAADSIVIVLRTTGTFDIIRCLGFATGGCHRSLHAAARQICPDHGP